MAADVDVLDTDLGTGSMETDIDLGVEGLEVTGDTDDVIVVTGCDEVTDAAGDGGGGESSKDQDGWSKSQDPSGTGTRGLHSFRQATNIWEGKQIELCGFAFCVH